MAELVIGVFALILFGMFTTGSFIDCIKHVFSGRIDDQYEDDEEDEF